MRSDVARELIAFEWLQKHFICTVSLGELTPGGASACCSITTVALETGLCKHWELSRESKLHPSAKLAGRWETNKITDGESRGSWGGGGLLEARAIFPQFSRRWDERRWCVEWLTGEKWLDWVKAEPPGLVRSSEDTFDARASPSTGSWSLIALWEISSTGQCFVLHWHRGLNENKFNRSCVDLTRRKGGSQTSEGPNRKYKPAMLFAPAPADKKGFVIDSLNKRERQGKCVEQEETFNGTGLKWEDSPADSKRGEEARLEQYRRVERVVRLVIQWGPRSVCRWGFSDSCLGIPSK